MIYSTVLINQCLAESSSERLPPELRGFLQQQIQRPTIKYLVKLSEFPRRGRRRIVGAGGWGGSVKDTWKQDPRDQVSNVYRGSQRMKQLLWILHRSTAGLHIWCGCLAWGFCSTCNSGSWGGVSQILLSALGNLFLLLSSLTQLWYVGISLVLLPLVMLSLVDITGKPALTCNTWKDSGSGEGRMWEVLGRGRKGGCSWDVLYESRINKYNF